MLALVDGSEENREAALAAADLFASTPGLQFTVLAPAEVAQPAPPDEVGVDGGSTGSGTLLQSTSDTSILLETMREIEDRGLTTRMRTVEGDLEERAAEIAGTHDLVVLPPRMADRSDEFPVPAIVAP